MKKATVSALCVAITTALLFFTVFARAAEVQYGEASGVLPSGLPFSEAVRVDDVLYLSGQIGVVPGSLKLVPGGVAAESRQTMENIAAALEANGLQLSDVVKCTVMLADIAEWGAFNEIYQEYFEAPYPARSAMGVNGLAVNARVELECMAAYRGAEPAVQGVPQSESLALKSDRERANKQLVKRWLSELWDQGDYEVARELLADNFQRHSAGHPARGPDAYAAIVKSCHDGFPDTRIVMVDELLADGDRVFVRWRWTGTHQAPFRGIAATGKAIDVLGEDVIRIEDGAITDIWPLFDPLRLMLQIGAISEEG